MRWNTVKRQAAIYLSFGYTIGRVSKMLGCGTQDLEDWLRQGEFAAAVDAMSEQHAKMMHELLEDAERKAVMTAIEAMEATDVVVDERGNEHQVPNWKVRQAAADSLLDRAGKRGKAIQKSEAKQLTGDITQALSKALSEPALRHLLGGPQATEAFVDWEYVPDETPKPKQAEAEDERGRGTVESGEGSVPEGVPEQVP